MGERSDPVIARMKVREVTGVFHSREAVDDAVDALLVAGFDRADIDVLDSIDEVQRRLGHIFVSPDELPDVPGLPRREVVKPEDFAVTAAMTTAVAGFGTAAFAAFVVMASGNGIFPTAVAALIAAVVGGGIGFWLVSRYFDRNRAASLEPAAEARGFVLWVRPRSPEFEATALRILRRFGGEAVRVHETEIERRIDDIPLASLEPDPWLGPERLGQP
jgi:hypothetical protein